MTRKELEKQKEINSIVLGIINDIDDDIENTGLQKVGKLRTFTATVYETKHYYILESYNTFVAAIHKDSRIMVDFLRYVYGYTSTSAQHIAKFRNDYHAANEYRYYNILGITIVD